MIFIPSESETWIREYQAGIQLVLKTHRPITTKSWLTESLLEVRYGKMNYFILFCCANALQNMLIFSFSNIFETYNLTRREHSRPRRGGALRSFVTILINFSIGHSASLFPLRPLIRTLYWPMYEIETPVYEFSSFMFWFHEIHLPYFIFSYWYSVPHYQCCLQIINRCYCFYPWLLLGNYWILSIKWPEYEQKTYKPDDWCNKKLYIFALVHLGIIYTVILAAIVTAIGFALCRFFACSWFEGWVQKFCIQLQTEKRSFFIIAELKMGLIERYLESIYK